MGYILSSSNTICMSLVPISFFVFLFVLKVNPHTHMLYRLCYMSIYAGRLKGRHVVFYLQEVTHLDAEHLPFNSPFLFQIFLNFTKEFCRYIESSYVFSIRFPLLLNIRVVTLTPLSLLMKLKSIMFPRETKPMEYRNRSINRLQIDRQMIDR